MENMGIGLELMGIGMVTVFAILLIVIFGSRLLITIINRIAPEESKPEKAAPAAASSAGVVETAAHRVISAKILPALSSTFCASSSR